MTRILKSKLEQEAQGGEVEGGRAAPPNSGGQPSSGEEEQSGEFDFSQLDDLFAPDGDDESAPVEGGAEEPSSEESARAPSGQEGEEGEPSSSQGASEEEGGEAPSSTEQTGEEQQASSGSEEQTGTEGQEGEQQPEASQLSNEELQEQIRQAQEQAKNELLQSEEFQVTEEEADQLLTEPTKVLPQILARTQLKMFQDTVRQLNASIPSQVDQVLSQREQAKQHEDRFLGEYPELKGNMDTVRKVARAVANAGEFQSQQEFERMVAAQSFFKLGKQLPSRFVEGGEQGQQEGGGEAQSSGRPESESQPHQPAGAGQPDGPTSPQQQNSGEGFWSRLNRELDEEFEEI